MRRAFAIVCWTAVFFAAAIVLSFSSGLYVIDRLHPAGDARHTSAGLFDTLMVWAPLLLAPIGLALVYFGKLPGTAARRAEK